jgi:hypothetical protein
MVQIFEYLFLFPDAAGLLQGSRLPDVNPTFNEPIDSGSLKTEGLPRYSGITRNFPGH